MSAPNLAALQHGDPDAWDEAFRWLWPTAFAVAQLKLQPYLPEDVEDVAIESAPRHRPAWWRSVLRRLERRLAL